MDERTSPWFSRFLVENRVSPSVAHVSHADLATATLDKKILTLAWGLLQLQLCRPDNGSRRLIARACPERSARVSTSQIELSNVDRAEHGWRLNRVLTMPSANPCLQEDGGN